MSTNQIGQEAAARRDAARSADGTFGTQQHDPADASVLDDPTTVERVDGFDVRPWDLGDGWSMHWSGRIQGPGAYEADIDEGVLGVDGHEWSAEYATLHHETESHDEYAGIHSWYRDGRHSSSDDVPHITLDNGWVLAVDEENSVDRSVGNGITAAVTVINPNGTQIGCEPVGHDRFVDFVAAVESGSYQPRGGGYPTREWAGGDEHERLSAAAPPYRSGCGHSEALRVCATRDEGAEVLAIAERMRAADGHTFNGATFIENYNRTRGATSYRSYPPFAASWVEVTGSPLATHTEALDAVSSLPSHRIDDYITMRRGGLSHTTAERVAADPESRREVSARVNGTTDLDIAEAKEAKGGYALNGYLRIRGASQVAHADALEVASNSKLDASRYARHRAAGKNHAAAKKSSRI